jgi:hypothetical protein
MHNPKIALLAYCLAAGFILVVAFHTPSKTLIAASAQVPPPIADPK